MSAENLHKKTFRDDNEFHFVCPIFATEVKITTCFELRHQKWRGVRLPVRKGCQCCMTSNKCPINSLMEDVMRTDDDPYYSKEKVVGKLKQRHLDRVNRIMTTEEVIKRYDLSEKEIELIQLANKNAGLNIKPKNSNRFGPALKPVQTSVVAIEAAPAPELKSNAAITGDMSAAITAAVKEHHGQQ